jgi:hypothetical protein
LFSAFLDEVDGRDMGVGMNGKDVQKRAVARE